MNQYFNPFSLREREREIFYLTLSSTFLLIPSLLHLLSCMHHTLIFWKKNFKCQIGKGTPLTCTYTTLCITPHTGCITFLTTTDDEGKAYNDGLWHGIFTHRQGNKGLVIVDNNFRLRVICHRLAWCLWLVSAFSFQGFLLRLVSLRVVVRWGYSFVPGWSVKAARFCWPPQMMRVCRTMMTFGIMCLPIVKDPLAWLSLTTIIEVPFPFGYLTLLLCSFYVSQLSLILSL